MKKYRNIQILLFALLVSIVPVNSANAGNIVPGNIYARFFDTHSRINFGLAQGDVTVTDDAVTGYAWAEDWGWINFAPTLGGVENDGNGNLSGYAWGETLGWINFDPTLGGVTIDEDGFFSGYAWAENGGWIEFNCAEPDACVETTWPGDGEEDGGGGGSPGQQAPGEGGDEEDPDEEEPPVVEPPLPPTEEEPSEEPGEEPTESDPDGEDEDDEGDTKGPGGSEPEDEEPGGGTGGGSDEPDPVVSPITEIVETITGSIEDILDNPLTPPTTTALATVGGLVGISSLGMSFLTPLTITEIFLWPSRLWTLLLAALGFRKKRLPWGTVYDSVTKQPLDPAYVQLVDQETGKDAETAFTDLDGRFGFLPRTGSYTMKARKTNYAFPSKRLFGNTSDALYDHLYFGENVDIHSENDVVIRNIPLDPIGVDWNEVQKRKGGIFNFYSKYDVIFYTFTSILFYLGLAIAIFAAFFFPSLTHTVLLIIYSLIVLVRGLTGSPKRLGTIHDKNGDPLAYAAVRVYIANTENQVKQVVTNQFGKFYCLVVPATYYIKVFKRVGEEEFEEVYRSENFYAKDGLVDGRFTV